MHVGIVYVTKPPVFIVGVAPQVSPLRPSSWILNHTALIIYVSTCTCKTSGDLLSSRHPVIAASVRALGHVGDGRTDVCVRPKRPVELNFGASRDFGVERSGRGATAL